MQSLVQYHSFGFDVSCAKVQLVKSIDALLELLPTLQDSLFLFLGEGSNTAFIEDYSGVVLINKLKGISVYEDDSFYHVNVGSGENWHEFVQYCLKNKMYGMENLALIPGTVGAAPIQNIGAYGLEVKDFIHSVEFIDIQTGFMGYFNNKECEFAYRDSHFKNNKIGKRIITSVNFAIPKDYRAVTSYSPIDQLHEPQAEDIFKKVIETRQTKLPDPKVLGNAGSFFKNPVIDMSQYINLQASFPDIPGYATEDNKVKVPAAWLIEKLGFKGQFEDDIGCYEKQALVLINRGSGSGLTLLSLARRIKRKVSEDFGINLENEVQIIGQYGRISV